MAGFKVLLIIIASVMLIGCTQANNTDIISDTGTSLSDLENEVTESNILFPDNIEQITEIGDAAVSFEEVSDRITHTKAYPEGRSLVHKDTVRALERTFYVISAVYDNGDTVSAERTFWADVQTGDIYLYYDPVTMPNEQYSEYVGEISEDDGRSRLIPIDHDPDEWTKENIGTFLGTLDDIPERYYNFADIDSDGSEAMHRSLTADHQLMPRSTDRTITVRGTRQIWIFIF